MYKQSYLKRGYVTQSYVDEVEKRLYNNLPVKDLLDEVLPVESVDEDTINGILKPGEKYCRLESPFEYIIVTDIGRVINLLTLKMYSLRVGNTSFHLYISGKNVKEKLKPNLKEIFLEQGWDYDFEKLVQNYIDNKWRCVFGKEYKSRR